MEIDGDLLQRRVFLDGKTPDESLIRPYTSSVPAIPSPLSMLFPKLIHQG